jgi:hypothetical protein
MGTALISDLPEDLAELAEKLDGHGGFCAATRV